jgi:hypothetical protein
MKTIRPFLSILTPTHARPRMLEICKASVKKQIAADRIQHMIMMDEEGVGIAGMYKMVPNCAPYLIGDYIQVLCDDDIITDPDMTTDLMRIVEESHPLCIMVKWHYGPMILPNPNSWGIMPVLGEIGISNWIVQGDIWRSMSDCHGWRYEGDYDFIHAIWPMVSSRTYWYDKFVLGTQVGRGFGKTEVDLYGE